MPNIPKTEDEIITNSIQESFDTRDKFLDYALETKASLQFAQLSHLQTAANIAIAVMGIGLVKGVVGLSLTIAVSNLSFLSLIILVNAYVRETIDNNDKAIEDTRKMVFEETDKTIKSAVLAKKNRQPSSFF